MVTTTSALEVPLGMDVTLEATEVKAKHKESR
jgi:hypothetical protein